MPSVSTHHFLAAMRGAQLKGWSRQSLLAEAGMKDNFDYAGEQRFSIDQMTRLTRTIWRVLDDEFMGFTRTQSKPGTFAFCVKAMSKERTLRDALMTGSTFYSLVTDDIETEIIEHGDHAVIDIRFQHPELDPDYYFEDFWMVIWHRLASWFTGLRIPLQYVNFTQAKPPHSRELNYMFPGVLDFGTTSSQLAFDARHLELPISRSSREVDRFLARSPFYLLSIPGSEGMLHGTIVSMLTPEGNGVMTFPSIEEIAAQLGCSGGTLRRRLREESSSYSKIKDELRRNVAYKLLADESIPIEDVALAAGYSTASPFIRAFNQWSGTSPRQYRRKLRPR
ncbi:hypothetical protein A3709_17100 [Halioglobus sp. HI00S01]|uniref:AraC family transcriptional regulator n=1 Tax=Halioglobus sp. HI00S01 TaxID=1822214 RepID=UPI0007C38310|nr:AraC family transcriptional regulator [Halioglobus sp. HI00S01]KZX58720.1 hypothetical protein A3709_17100 [Halioglobus sp. HI00S01]